MVPETQLAIAERNALMHTTTTNETPTDAERIIREQAQTILMLVDAARIYQRALSPFAQGYQIRLCGQNWEGTIRDYRAAYTALKRDE